MGTIVEEKTINQTTEIIQAFPSSEVTELVEKKEIMETFEIPSVREISLSDYDFKNQGFFSSEVWTKTFNLHARISKVAKTKVTCECVVDRENKLFEIRTFPNLLFDHLQNKEINHPVIVSIKTKPGSTRIDIRDGKNIVDLSIFDLNDGWKELYNSGLDKPLSTSDDSTNI
jgi:hypothetical protein